MRWLHIVVSAAIHRGRRLTGRRVGESVAVCCRNDGISAIFSAWISVTTE